MKDKIIIKITLMVLILGLITLFSYLKQDTTYEYKIVCPNGSTEKYNQSKILVCGKIQSQLIITYDDILKENIKEVLLNVT